jgi:DNA repair protein RecN (Recombination protein N)
MIYRNGTSKCYFNFSSCSLQTLKDFTVNHVDLVGQFANQKLLSNDYQLGLLDQFSKCENELNKYQGLYENLINLQNSLNESNDKLKNIIERKDYLLFQLNEFNQVDLSENLEISLAEKKSQLLEKIKLKEKISTLEVLIDGDEQTLGILNSIKQAEKLFTSFIDPDSRMILEELQKARIIIEDVSFNSQKKEKSNDEESELLETISNHLGSIQKLKRKFDCDMNQLISKKLEMQNELDSIELLQSSKKRLENEISLAKESCWQLANQLHKNRINFAKKFSVKITEDVRFLKMDNATFKISLEELSELNNTGCTKILFLAETNLGEGFHPIKNIASGGELSRILLTIRQLISSDDSVSIFLFDEIDSGIGGQTAKKIGLALKAIAKRSQVIAVTHLPQVAQHCDKLICVDKDIENSKGYKRTISTVSTFSGLKIKNEIERMNQLN